MTRDATDSSTTSSDRAEPHTLEPTTEDCRCLSEGKLLDISMGLSMVNVEPDKLCPKDPYKLLSVFFVTDLIIYITTTRSTMTPEQAMMIPLIYVIGYIVSVAWEMFE